MKPPSAPGTSSREKSRAESRPTRDWRQLGRDVLHGAVDLVYPRACLACFDRINDSSPTSFCPACLDDFQQTNGPACPRCAATVGPYSLIEDGCPNCKDQGFSFDRVIRLGTYRGRLRDCVLRMKHRGGEDLAECLGQLLGMVRVEELRAYDVDMVIPVPLHWLRWMQRGYNQASSIAAALAKALAKPYRPSLLWRRRYTPHQTGLSATERRKSLHGSFWARKPPELRGKTVLLVDDVLTTGSTCHEAARTLRRAAASRVIVAVLARSENPF